MFDVVVIGAGHAGVEAAAAAARRGARVALLTFRRSDIGQMSCNPSIGGVGKGHLVREIDALGGIMARAADRAAIHRRMLNRSKGPAVRGPRIQADRPVFAAAVAALLPSEAEILEGEVVSLRIRAGRATGVDLADGRSIDSSAVVIATGTFLAATLHRGRESWAGGRVGSLNAVRLANQIAELGLSDTRLKTGTPPRLDGRTIDWSRLEPQPSDQDAWRLALLSPPVGLPQVACAITRTTEGTHEIIRAAFDQSPMKSGQIEGRGPRYCPSIEDKVERFSDRDSHQIFLEPEGLRSTLVYPNGISTSLPADVQLNFCRSIPGLERVEMPIAGYAVEYQFADPRRLSPTLEHQDIGGLFFAGQINGTTGYEEAGAQGVLAGANAAAVALDLSPLNLSRADSYIGVMADDLTVQGVTEPYRMLTARAEHRLYLRADNAISRLSAMAREAGLLEPAMAEAVGKYQNEVEGARGAAEKLYRSSELGGAAEDSRRLPLREWMRKPETEEKAMAILGASDAAREVACDTLYEPYVLRQRDDLARQAANKDMAIGAAFDFSSVPGLSVEMISRLRTSRPTTLDQASRVAGVTPAALAALHFALLQQ